MSFFGANNIMIRKELAEQQKKDQWGDNQGDWEVSVGDWCNDQW